MKKLKLDVDDLQIVGFTTVADANEDAIQEFAATRACTLGSCGMICP